MNMKELEGMQPMEHLPQEEREKVGQQRRRELGLLYERISKLKDRLERKEERLQECETSIEQLRYSKVMGIPLRSDGVRACSTLWLNGAAGIHNPTPRMLGSALGMLEMGSEMPGKGPQPRQRQWGVHMACTGGKPQMEVSS